MMMTVTLYKNTSDARCISKNLSEGIEITCREFDNGSIMNPRLIVEYNSEYANKNYCFIIKVFVSLWRLIQHYC